MKQSYDKCDSVQKFSVGYIKFLSEKKRKARPAVQVIVKET